MTNKRQCISSSNMMTRNTLGRLLQWRSGIRDVPTLSWGGHVYDIKFLIDVRRAPRIYHWSLGRIELMDFCTKVVHSAPYQAGSMTRAHKNAKNAETARDWTRTYGMGCTNHKRAQDRPNSPILVWLLESKRCRDLRLVIYSTDAKMHWPSQQSQNRFDNRRE